MKRSLLYWAGWTLFVAMAPVGARGATVAQVQLNCLSLRFQPASASAAGLNYTLELTTDSSGAAGINGELAPLPSGGLSSHATFFRLTGDVLFEPVNGTLFLNVPNLSDANTNGIPDFFETALAVAGVTTSGTFDGTDQSGKLSAAWQREANSKDGSCRLTMDAYNLTFTLKFEVQEFAGSLQYRNIAGEPTITASANLTKTSQPAVTLSGSTVLTKGGSGSLALQSGTLRNSSGQASAYQNIDELERSGSRYIGQFFFKDGDPTTVFEDYVSWVLKIIDPNDSNRNGIPDLSDEGGIRAPPLLSLRQSGTNLLLGISGELGKLHRVESTPGLEKPVWAIAASVTLTNDPQTVLLRAPTNRTRTAYWRVSVP